MRTAIVEVIFPNADVNEIPNGFFAAVDSKAKEWGGTAINTFETPTTDQQKKQFEEMPK